MLARKTQSILAVLTLLLASCGKTKDDQALTTQAQVEITSVQNLSSELDKYFSNSNVNLLLAQAYSQSVYASMNDSDRQELKKIIINLSPEELKNIKSAIQSKIDDKVLRAKYLTDFNEDPANSLLNDVFENSIFTNDSFYDQKTVDLNKVVFVSLSDLRNRNVSAVMNEYKSAIDSMAKEIAGESIVSVLTEREVKEIKNIEEQTVSEDKRIQKLADYLAKINLEERLTKGSVAYFNFLNIVNTDYFSQAEKIEATSGAVVLGTVFLMVKNKEEFQRAKNAVIKAKNRIEVFQELLKTAKAVTESFKEDTKELMTSVNDTNNALKKMLNTTKDAALDASDRSIKGNDNLPKRIKNFKKDKLNNAQEVKAFTENLGNVANKTIKITEDVDAAIDLLNKGLIAAGITPGKDLVKAMEVAAKTNKAISAGMSALKSFSTGNYFGAANSILNFAAGGEAFPGAKKLEAIDKKLGVMDKKLDTIIELNKQMLELQKTTMTMIKDLTLSMEDFHNEEMNLLEDIKYGVGVLDDKLDEIAQKKISPCWDAAFKIMGVDSMVGRKDYNYLKKNLSKKAISYSTPDVVNNKLESCYTGLTSIFKTLDDSNFSREAISANQKTYDHFISTDEKLQKMLIHFDPQFRSSIQNTLMFAPVNFTGWKNWKNVIDQMDINEDHNDGMNSLNIYRYFANYRGQAWLDYYASPLLAFAPYYAGNSFKSNIRGFSGEFSTEKNNLDAQVQIKQSLKTTIDHLRLKVLQEVILSGIFSLDDEKINLNMILTADPSGSATNKWQYIIDSNPMFRINLLNFKIAKLLSNNPGLIHQYAKAYNNTLLSLQKNGAEKNEEFAQFLSSNLGIKAHVALPADCSPEQKSNCAKLKLSLELIPDQNHNYSHRTVQIDLPYLEDISDVNNIQFIYSHSLRVSLQMLNDAIKEYNLLNYKVNEISGRYNKYYVLFEALNQAQTQE